MAAPACPTSPPLGPRRPAPANLPESGREATAASFRADHDGKKVTVELAASEVIKSVTGTLPRGRRGRPENPDRRVEGRFPRRPDADLHREGGRHDRAGRQQPGHGFPELAYFCPQRQVQSPDPEGELEPRHAHRDVAMLSDDRRSSGRPDRFVGRGSTCSSEVQRLVRRLDSPHLAQREAAEAELLRRGPAILDVLPPVTDRMPAEVRHRLGRIREQLEQQAANVAADASTITLRPTPCGCRRSSRLSNASRATRSSTAAGSSVNRQPIRG